jgi:molecular chaperone GrpE
MTVPSPEEHEAQAPEESSGPVIRDNRRIDPVTGEARVRVTTPEAPAAAPLHGDATADGVDPVIAQLTTERDAHLADLQRVTAEYSNYRKRVERDRQAVAEQSLVSVLTGLLPVLDDIDRAREHGELEGGVKSIAENLESTLTKLGLQRYGAVGEPFDPTVHEALTHGHSADVTEPSCAEVFQPGYRLGDRVLRPARVAVVDPEPGEPASE